MSHTQCRFHSAEWFPAVQPILANARDLDAAAAALFISVNFKIVSSPADRVHTSHIVIARGAVSWSPNVDADSTAKVEMPLNVATACWLSEDETLPMRAFLAGKLTLVGGPSDWNQLSHIGLRLFRSSPNITTQLRAVATPEDLAVADSVAV